MLYLWDKYGLSMGYPYSSMIREPFMQLSSSGILAGLSWPFDLFYFEAEGINFLLFVNRVGIWLFGDVFLKN